MIESNPDIIIVGGGIAGGALSTVMARKGFNVLMLEKSTEHIDRVRGEWMAPWGVKELMNLGVYEAMIAAGGHHLAKAITFDEFIDPEMAKLRR